MSAFPIPQADAAVGTAQPQSLSAAAVSDSRPWVKYLILLYAVLFLSAVNRCCGYRTAADKQQRDPQQQIGIEYLVMLFQIPQMPLSLNRVF